MSSKLPDSQVFFRSKHAKKNWLGAIIDTLLMPWVLSENKKTRIGHEITAYLKSMEKADFHRSGDPILAYLQSQQCERPDFTAIIVQMQGLFQRMKYEPSAAVGSELCSFIVDRFDNDGEIDTEWREDSNREWQLTPDDLNKLFRLLRWTKGEFEAIAAAIVERSPGDIGLRNLVAHLRNFTFDHALSLANVSINPEQLFLELGDRRFCPNAAVIEFWKAVGLKLGRRPAHPIDGVLVPEPPFIDQLSIAEVGVKQFASAYRKDLARFMALHAVVLDIHEVSSIWDMAIDKYFHLGPTAQLLDRTIEVFREVEELFGESKAKSSDFCKKFAAVGEQFSSAAKTLRESLLVAAEAHDTSDDSAAES